MLQCTPKQHNSKQKENNKYSNQDTSLNIEEMGFISEYV
jgi:hypothetical protein